MTKIKTPATYCDPYNERGVLLVRSEPRAFGSMPFCTPAPHDRTLVEIMNIHAKESK